MAERFQDAPETPYYTLGMNPIKFALWLIMVSVLMLFGALTSAYIVRRAEGNWYIFDVPTLFYYSSVILLVSSVTMQMALNQARKNNMSQLKAYMLSTIVLGSIFCVLQFYGWGDLVNMNVFFAGSNVAGSFFYVLSGLHWAHLISGLVFLIVVLRAVFQYKVHSKNMNLIEMCNTFWHFLDALWLYLFIFLLLNR